MFSTTQLIGFGSGGSLTQQIVSLGGLTSIGDHTNPSRAFDGTTNSTAANCTNSASAVVSYLGKTLTATKLISGFVYYPSNDQGVHDGAGNQELQLWVKTGSAPANAADGTALFAPSPAADTTSVQTNLTGITPTSADHVWVRIISTGSAQTHYCAELQFYESV